MYKKTYNSAEMVQYKQDTKALKSQPKVFQLSDFQLGVVVGCGKFGKVCVAIEKKTGFLVAIKAIKKDLLVRQELEQQLFYEIFFHSKLKHPNITRLYTYFYDEKCYYFVLEYASNGSLYVNMRLQKYKRFTPDLAAKYIYQTALALDYCHSLDFFHGDVKPENILLDSKGDVKLSDFGLAWPSDHTVASARGLCGTRDYLAPEQLNLERYNQAIDNWSLGVMCFELLVGRSPFASKRRETTVQRILNVAINFPKVVTPDAEDLIRRLVTYDPNSRLSFQRVMSHEWIKTNYLDAKT